MTDATRDHHARQTVGRADLHVHSRYSTVTGNLRFLRSRDCYSSPLDVYRTAKRRGMDVVTITDHDAIDGWRELMDARPDADDILPGEEVSCRLPDGNVLVHLGVYGITERVHAEIQPLRENVFDVIALLRESGTFFALNHILHFYRDQAPLERYLQLLSAVPALEARNAVAVVPGASVHVRPTRRRVCASLPATRAIGGASPLHSRVNRSASALWISSMAPFLVSSAGTAESSCR